MRGGRSRATRHLKRKGLETRGRVRGGVGARAGVANAHPEVLAMAHEVTASNEDDGVARVIEALLEQAEG